MNNRSDPVESSLPFEHQMLVKRIEIAGFEALRAAATTEEGLNKAVTDMVLVMKKNESNRAVAVGVTDNGKDVFDQEGSIHIKQAGVEVKAGEYYIDSGKVSRTYTQLSAMLGKQESEIAIEMQTDKQFAIYSGLVFAVGQNDVFGKIQTEYKALENAVSGFVSVAQKNVFSKFDSELVGPAGITNETKNRAELYAPVYNVMNKLIIDYEKIDNKNKAAKKEMQALLTSVFNTMNDLSKSPEIKLNEIATAVQRSGLSQAKKDDLLLGVNYDKHYESTNDKHFIESLQKLLDTKNDGNSPTITKYKNILNMNLADRQKIDMILNGAHQAMDKRSSAGILAGLTKYNNEATKIHGLIKQFAVNPVMALEGINGLLKKAPVVPVVAKPEVVIATKIERSPERKHRSHTSSRPVKSSVSPGYQQPHHASEMFGQKAPKEKIVPNVQAKEREYKSPLTMAIDKYRKENAVKAPKEHQDEVSRTVPGRRR